MAALLGIGDGVFNTQLSALIGIFFKHDTVWQISTFSPFLYKFCLSINFRTTTLTNRISLVFRGHAGRSICTAQGVAVWRRCTHLLHQSIHLITGNAGAYALCNLPRIRLLSISASSRSQINLASLSSGSGSWYVQHETLNHFQEKRKKVVIVIQVWISLCFVTLSKSISSTL